MPCATARSRTCARQCSSASRARRTCDGFELHAPGLDLGQVEDVVEQLEQVPAGVEDVAEVLLLPVVDVTEHALQQHLGEPDHGVERRAQLVRHAGEELGLVPAGHLQLAGLVAAAPGTAGR